MTAPSAPTSWVAEAIERAAELLEHGEESEAVRLLTEAGRGAIAQGYPELLPTIAALADEASSRCEGRTRRRAKRVASRIGQHEHRIAVARHVPDAPPGRTAPTPSAPRVIRRHPRGRVVAYIWIGVFVAGVISVAVLADDNAATDDAAAIGVLAAVAGAILTGVYVVASLIFEALEERSRARRSLARRC